MQSGSLLMLFRCSRRPFSYVDRVYDEAAREMNLRMLAAEFSDMPMAEIARCAAIGQRTTRCP